MKRQLAASHGPLTQPAPGIHTRPFGCARLSRYVAMSRASGDETALESRRAGQAARSPPGISRASPFGVPRSPVRGIGAGGKIHGSEKDRRAGRICIGLEINGYLPAEF
jgi:hypothetical protein